MVILAGEMLEASEFYRENYETTRLEVLDGTRKRLVLRDEQHSGCRFCRLLPPLVTFRREAHAIPEMLGNHELVSAYECDSCNRLFGKTIELDLGRWTLPSRSLLGIGGKKRRHPIAQDRDGSWKVQAGDNTILFEKQEDGSLVVEDPASNSMSINIPRGPYVPVAVLKALVRIGLMLIPGSDIEEFTDALDWIRTPSLVTTSDRRFRFPIGHTFVPGNPRKDRVLFFLLRRKAPNGLLPYTFLIFGYGMEMFQVQIPAFRKDQVWRRDHPIIPFFPVSLFVGVNRLVAQQSVLDLTSAVTVRTQAASFRATYESSSRTRHDP